MTSLRTRILFFFTLFALASVLAIYLSSRNTVNVGTAAEIVVSQHLPMVQSLTEMEVAVERLGSATERYLLTGDKRWWDECEKERANYTTNFLEAQRFAMGATEQDKLRELDELYVEFDNQTRELLMGTRQFDKIKGQFAQCTRTLYDMRNLIAQLEDIRHGMAIVRQEQIHDTLAHHKRLAFYFLAIIAVFFFALAIYLWHFLVHPLSLLVDGIRNFTRGKTDVQIPSVGKDELGELQEAFNEMSRELEVERKRLKSESQSDALTGLFNMRYFRTQLGEEFSRSQRYGRPLTLLLIDVDHFKSYNDQNGHPAGDIVLKEVSRILIRNVRGTDIVARYGGEEFVVLLPETPLDASASVAEKMRKTVEDHYFPFAGTESGEKLTVSIGIAAYPDTHVTSDQDLIEAADKALYAAKKGGRNRVFLFAKGETTTADGAFAARPPKEAAATK